MLGNVIFTSRLIFGLLCYVVVGSVFAWTPLWAEALNISESLSQGRAFVISRAIIIILALTLTSSLAWLQAGAISWAKTFGWLWVITCGFGIVLGAVSGGITFTVVWVFVVFIAWVGAWCLVGARERLSLSFSEFYTILILAGTGIFGLILGALIRLITPSTP